MQKNIDYTETRKEQTRYSNSICFRRNKFVVNCKILSKNYKIHRWQPLLITHVFVQKTLTLNRTMALQNKMYQRSHTRDWL